MRLKTYRGADTKSVLDRIKTELGPDAVILGTRQCEDNGRNICEITAALEDNPGQQHSETHSGNNGTHHQETSVSGTGPQTQTAPKGPPPGWDQWHQEWSEIKHHLLTLLRPQLDLHLLTPIQRQSLEYLEREGVTGQVIMDIYTELKNQPGTSILGPLERMVHVRAWNNELWPQKFHAVAGPHGVGKTSALLRMALAVKREKPRTRICLVNTDQRRLQSRLILQHYAELSEFDFLEAQSPVEFAQLVSQNAQDYDKIFLDLPGLERGQTLERLMGRLGLDAARDLVLHIAFSPHFASSQLKEFERQYYSPLAKSLIWTKCDEACSFGAIVNTAVATSLPISALSYGTGLAETMAAAKHVPLWRLVFKHKLPNEQ